ncbi:hypothetical protein [Frigoriglobus tundricola]|uniref:Uncharacterized protein n=1 Tax=Frigoriglobus tundricola TaxID=2774151 RepID=A0A6M5YIE8_9BACT|nr:hypothetical protein [Frigoriglobus tundricola]QJW93090.1 hypothetical protein FTUN_0593 [Frigoriglobus tundricola]
MADSAFGRMNISLPTDLKREMDAVKDVNWSNVAAEAFRLKLLEIRSSQKGATMQQVVNRMKAAAKLEESAEHRAGKQAGEKWARDTATPAQLRRLAEIRDELFVGVPDTFGWPGILYVTFHKGADVDRAEVNGYWSSVLGEKDAERIYEEQFASAFVEGALAVWAIVEPQL